VMRLRSALTVALSVFCLAAAALAGPPSAPLVIDMAAEGKTPGKRGGVLRTLLSKEKDVRLLNVWGYARLIAWTPDLQLKPDIAESITVEAGKKFTIKLRKGHLWSDGQPFTSADFKYFWEDIANNKELTPAGVPIELLNDGAPPKVTFPDAQTIVYEYAAPNPNFLATLAKARDLFIYRPAHYLKKFHAKYAAQKSMAAAIQTAKVSQWAALHNRLDSMYGNDNPDLPTLQPWMVTSAMPAQKFVFRRNPHFHRVDKNGTQLPYIDTLEVSIVDRDLIPVKASAGETDLQAPGLNFADLTALKRNEAKGGYKVRAWPSLRGSHVALYPNLNAKDPVWRKLNRDARYRRALSRAIDRSEINKILFFGLAIAGNNAPVSPSPFADVRWTTADAAYDPKAANALLDEIGLTKRGTDGTRLLPDGRPMELVVESSGESKEESDILQLVSQHFKRIGVRMLYKAADRTIMRNRAYSGDAVMTAFVGWDNGAPSADMSPDELAPVWQTGLAWPKWGQHYETKGKTGEPVDVAAAKELMTLNQKWRSANADERAAIWRRMLEIHAIERFVIGVVSGVLQPVLVSAALRNVPEKGRWGWDPGAQFGMYRLDTFWLDRK
jgi:peptide/nickel transport system substrate-binding protein